MIQLLINTSLEFVLSVDENNETLSHQIDVIPVDYKIMSIGTLDCIFALVYVIDADTFVVMPLSDRAKSKSTWHLLKQQGMTVQIEAVLIEIKDENDNIVQSYASCVYNGLSKTQYPLPPGYEAEIEAFQQRR